jgi:hypothetical protein
VQPGRRWLQFGFATLLKLVVVAAVLSAWWADRERLTNRIGRLESDQSVLRIAIGDDVEELSVYDDPFVAAGSPYGATPWGPPGGAWPVTSVSPSFVPSTVYVPAPTASPPPNFNAPAPIPVAGAPALGSVTVHFRVTLHNFLKTHEQWLKAHCDNDRGWQEFLARGAPEPAYPVPPTSAIPELPPLSTPDKNASPTPENPPVAVARQEDPPAKIAQQCLPAVVKLLAAGDVNARQQAAVVLADLGSLAAAAATNLADAANDPDQAVRQSALTTLAAMGPPAMPAAPRLTALLHDDDARCRPVEIAYALLRIDPQADVVSPLVESLRSGQGGSGQGGSGQGGSGQGGSGQGDRAWDRAVALDMLSSLNASNAAAALPAIEELLTDEDPNIRLRAAKAYSRLADRHDATETLRAALQNERHEAVKRGIARIIVRLQNAAR